MKTSSCALLAVKAMFSVVIVIILAPFGVAQIDVEIELAGPWSYMQDQHDPNRAMVIAPYANHTMAVFPGADVTTYGGVMATAQGIHELDLAMASCGAHPPSTFYLYPVNGVSGPELANVPYYAISLPKPCYYESHMESRFKYNSARKLIAGDQERSFTTWMTLHYKVTTASAILDNNTANPIAFTGSPSAISVVTYLDTAADKDCDSHSRHAFYLTESLWKLPHVYRVFPQLDAFLTYTQQLATYDYTCEQLQDPIPSGMTLGHNSSEQSNPPKAREAVGKINVSPGRADCHAAQFNVNGFVQ